MAGEPCEAADEPPPEASGEKLPLSIELNRALEMDTLATDALAAFTCAGVAEIIVRSLVSKPGG